jgi:hypothetical protein
MNINDRVISVESTGSKKESNRRMKKIKVHNLYSSHPVVRVVIPKG